MGGSSSKEEETPRVNVNDIARESLYNERERSRRVQNSYYERQPNRKVPNGYSFKKTNLSEISGEITYSIKEHSRRVVSNDTDSPGSANQSYSIPANNDNRSGMNSSIWTNASQNIIYRPNSNNNHHNLTCDNNDTHEKPTPQNQGDINSSTINTVNKASSNNSQNENGAQKTNVSPKHEVFMKKLFSSFNLKHRHMGGRGFYCDLCGVYQVYFKAKADTIFHDKSEGHIANLKKSADKAAIKLNYCKTCNAQFFSTIGFFVGHINSYYHKFLSEKSEEYRQSRKKDGTESKANSNQQRSRSNNRSSNRNSVHDEQQHFSPMPSLSLYDVLGEQNKFDSESKHNESFDGMNGSVTEEDLTAQDQNNDKKKKIINYAIIVKGLPANTTRGDIFNYFKDFGHIDDLKMNPEGLRTAKVVFTIRKCAKNLVESGLPISIKGQFVEITLIEE